MTSDGRTSWGSIIDVLARVCEGTPATSHSLYPGYAPAGREASRRAGQ